MDVEPRQPGAVAREVILREPANRERLDAVMHLLDAGAALTGKHRYISAIATLHHGTLAEEARQRWLDENRHRWEGIRGHQEKAVTMLEIMTAEFDPLPQPEGDYFFVRVYSTLSTVTGEAAPVPRELFNGPGDQYWAVNPATKALELVQGQFD
jgi:hypothetical protein